MIEKKRKQCLRNLNRTKSRYHLHNKISKINNLFSHTFHYYYSDKRDAKRNQLNPELH